MSIKFATLLSRSLVMHPNVCSDHGACSPCDLDPPSEVGLTQSWVTALPLLRLRHHLLSGSQFLPLSGGEIMVPVGAVGVTGVKEKISVNKTGGGWGCLCCLDPGGVPRALYSLTPPSGAIMIVSERRRQVGSCVEDPDWGSGHSDLRGCTCSLLSLGCLWAGSSFWGGVLAV